MTSLVFIGPPDVSLVYEGTKCVSAEMKYNMEAARVEIKEASIERTGYIGTFKRYHDPLRADYNKRRTTMDRDTSDAECLSMSLFSINRTVGPEAFLPTLLVFGDIPRRARTGTSPSQVKRVKTIEMAQKGDCKSPSITENIIRSQKPKRLKRTRDIITTARSPSWISCVTLQNKKETMGWKAYLRKYRRRDRTCPNVPRLENIQFNFCEALSKT